MGLLGTVLLCGPGWGGSTGAGTLTSKLLFSDGWLVGAAVGAGGDRRGARVQVGLLDWSLDSLSHGLSLGCVQRGTWVLRPAVEAAGLVRTWLGN